MNNVYTIGQQILAFAEDYGITAIITLALANLLIGVSVAIKNGEFKLYLVGGILKDITWIVVSYIGVAVVMHNAPLTTAVFAVATAQLSGDLMKNIGVLFPTIGASLPDMLIQPPYKRLGYSETAGTDLARKKLETEAGKE